MKDISFQVTRNCLTLLLPDDLGGVYIDDIRAEILEAIRLRRNIKAVIFDCINLRLIDHFDTQMLVDLVACIRLMGKQVGFCSIGPGLAAVLVSFNHEIQECTYGFNLDDTIAKLDR